MGIFAPPLNRTLQELRDDPEERVWRKDVRSTGWDGGTDLSSVDTAATKGYFVDFSAGAAQFETLFHKGADLGAWTTWSPSYTNITAGNATVVARYVQIGNLVVASFSFILGSTSAIGTGPAVSTPVAVASTTATDVNPAGPAYINDATAGLFVGSIRLLASLDRFLISVNLASGTHVSTAGITSTVPMTWTTSDSIQFVATYEAA